MSWNRQIKVRENNTTQSYQLHKKDLTPTQKIAETYPF